MNFVQQTLKFIWQHPLSSQHRVRALADYARWQVGSRLVPGAVAAPFVDDTRLLVRPGMTGATGNIYTGLHEFEDMAFVLHAMRATDLMLDVGANVGSYTVLAAGAVGARAITFEPVPHTFKGLTDNMLLNGLTERVRLHNCGLGRDAGLLRFTASSDMSNHVLSDGEDYAGDVIEVPIRPLDTLVEADEKPFLIKVDVEGFEAEVIAGGERVFSSDATQAVLLELTGHGSRYGHDEGAIHQQMVDWGYLPCAYHPYDRRIERLSDRAPKGNTLYLRDVAMIEDRVREADVFTVKGVRL
ncbi:MAG: FkbM family methyltransferase [Bradymonadia bacterium]